jgi:uncharacterized DUF497 family protein
MYYLGRMPMRIREFEWDEGNVVHIELGHGIKPGEVEEVFAERPLYRKTRKGHYAAMEPTQEGRYLTIVFELRKSGIARVITGWDMDKAELRYWQTHRG